MVPLSDTTIYVMETRGEFPRRFQLTNRCVAWDLAEVEAWLRQRQNDTDKVPDAYVLRPGLVKSLDWRVVGSSARFIRGNVKIDGAVFSAPVIYTNVLTNEIQRFTLDQLPLGLGPVKVGAFYFITNPLNYYYCDAIEGDRIRWILVESFQVGELYRGTYWQEASWGGTYIPVKDKAILSRLRRRLADYQDLERRRLAGEAVPTQTIASLFD